MDRLLLQGDVNCPGLAGTSTVDSDLTATLESFGYSQHVQTPTRANSVLEIIANVTPSLTTGVPVVEVGEISDHRLVVAELLVQRPVKLAVSYQHRNLKRIKVAQFEAQLRASALYTSLTCWDC